MDDEPLLNEKIKIEPISVTHIEPVPVAKIHHHWKEPNRFIRPLYWLAWRLDNSNKILLVSIIGILNFAILFTGLGWKKAFLISWILCISIFLLLVALVAIDADDKATKKRVMHEPETMRTLISIVVATLLSNICFGILLNSTKPTTLAHDHVLIILCAGAILLSWLLMHTIFGQYYCQIYYAKRDYSGQLIEGGERGGFKFPGTPEPSQLDFFYLAFMIGLSYSSSDVNITHRNVRKLILLHSLVSFIFYSTIVTSILNVAIF
jgi:uncharacterized membrane protein